MGFQQLQGQKRAISLLQADFSADRISHAYLFYGAQGSDKSQAASVYAQLLNCQKPDGADPCECCESCQKIASGNHPDVLRVLPDGASLKIAQMRGLQERAALKCYEGKQKVILIEEAHLLTTEAANSLLKILEEPPACTVFILLSRDTKSLPYTILSRCQAVSFNTLDTNLVITPEKEGLFKAIEKVADQLATLGYQDIFSWAETVDKDRETVEIVLEGLAQHIRSKMLVSFEKDSTGAIGNLNALHFINESIIQIKGNANTRLVLEVLLIKLRNIERGVNPID